MPGLRSVDNRSRARFVTRTPVVAGVFFVALSGLCTGASWGASSPAGASWGQGGPHGASWGSRQVIVRAWPGRARRVEAAVRRLDGRILRRLPIVHGLTVELTPAAAVKLRESPDVLSITPNTVLRPLGAAYDAGSDMGSMLSTTLITHAREYWQAGYTGTGVDIALIDSGVVPVDGLTAPGKVVNGPDLSFESQAPNLRYLDTYGHGTHMAGIIAGRSSSGSFLGMAPDARIVSIKVADAHGSTDVSQVIAAIDWVVQHRNDNGLDIRVLNLSYGTDSDQDYRLDPLAFAAEQAWKSGIAVVVAAGNAGFSKGAAGSLMNPADDPNVLAVGASDPSGTTDAADDTVAAFSSSGAPSRRVDLVAPGVHVVSLRAPGSSVDQAYGSSGLVADDLFRGSGTSQAAAVVSGAAALVIQQRPSITPDELKRLLTKSALKLHDAAPSAQGDGELDLAAAFGDKTPEAQRSDHSAASGTGSLDQSRGSIELAMNGIPLHGEQDIFGKLFDSPAMALLEASASSWSGGVWNGSSWSGSSWSTSSWSGSSWSASSWSASSWSGSSWSSVVWSTNVWAGSSWSGSSWSSNDWSTDSPLAAWAVANWG
jgi:serine protease AprX